MTHPESLASEATLDHQQQFSVAALTKYPPRRAPSTLQSSDDAKKHDVFGLLLLIRVK